ncbi:quinone oxidoreductase family protein [Pseudonocardia broussonetiae]|uniref:Zinc-binding dehydrogenase n=1 Tax=Pseudonocardia broussonetiae TaxID=2736640 RepID=A0A6M6JLQ1_9PSEU|nr:zinc-binding dehydrogenase [Pseudonocardia broussonetiae]QJY48868.1 zinc-binding dehydrogenase [Pseudonocardia broussonetiae]
MRAVLIHRDTTGTTLAVGEAPEPALAPGSVRIAVRAGSVNYVDQFVPEGGYGTPPADGTAWVAGLDAAGEVLEVGAGVTDVRVGDRVMTMTAGGLAEQVVVDARCLVPVPDGWSDEDAAAAVVGLLTECDALTAAGAFAPGDQVLVTGATSGMGMQGVQLARSLGAARVIALARSDRADDVLRGLGADLVLHSTGSGFADDVLAATGGNGVDLTVDHVGGAYFPDIVAATAVRGRIVNVGRVAGTEVTADLEAFSLKRLTLRGVTFRTRSADELAAMYAGVRALDLTDLRPTIDRVVPWEETQEAQRLLATGSVVGKVVIRVGA